MDVLEPPFILRKTDAIELWKDDTLLERFRCKTMRRLFACLARPQWKNLRHEMNCHGFVQYLIKGWEMNWIGWQNTLGEPMDMLDARQKFGLPFAIQFISNDCINLTHSALVIGWDGNEPILADKWGDFPAGIRHMHISRTVYPHYQVLCYPGVKEAKRP